MSKLLVAFQHPLASLNQREEALVDGKDALPQASFLFPQK